MQSRERIIDIKALIRCVVEKWRLLLLVGFLAGVVLAGIKGYSQYKLYKLSQGQQETAAQESGSQKGQILNVMHVAEVEREEYYTNSILGKINPHKEGKATADILVSIPANTAPAAAGGEPAATGGEPAAAGGEPAAAEGEPAAAEGEPAATGEEPAAQENSVKPQNIVNYYASTVLYRIDYTQAAEELGEDPALLGELVTAVPGTTDPSQLSVAVIYPTPEGAEVILDSILTQVRAARAEAQRIYGNHELLIVNEASGVVVDEELFKWANNRVVEIMALVNSQKTVGNNFTSSGSARIATVTQKDVAKTAVKWGVTGLIAGVVMTMVLIVIYLLAAGKVLSGREFNRHFGMKKIACVPSRKFTILKGLDKWAASIDSAYYNHPQRSVCLQVADAGIRAAVRPDAQIALVGDLAPEYLDKLAAEMNKSGASSGLGASYFGIPCMEQTPESVDSIMNCDAAVIVARAEKSCYKDAEDVLDACALLGREVIGSIVLM